MSLIFNKLVGKSRKSFLKNSFTFGKFYHKKIVSCEPLKQKNINNRYYEVVSNDLKLCTNFTDNQVEFKLYIKDVKFGGKNFPYIWLRENCKCSKCFNYKTKEVDLDLLQLRIDSKPETLENNSCNKLEIKWNDNHTSEYNLLELGKYALKNELNEYAKSLTPKTHWNKDILNQKGFAKLNYKDYLEDKSIFQKALKSIYQYGAVIIDGVPNNSDEIAKVCKPIGAIQPTVFGDNFCVVKNDSNEFSDRAYTDLSLRAHTDNVYLKNNSGLECFHVIKRPKQGGHSLLIDGFYCADLLKNNHIDDYNILSKTLVEFEFSNDDKFSYKYFDKHITENSLNGKLYQIKMNPYHKINLCHLTSDQIERYYQALQKFQMIIGNPENGYWIGLEESQVLIFDNFRLLHGRSKISGSRTLVTSYLSRDDYLSKLKVHLNINDF